MIAQPLFKKPAAAAAQPGYQRPADWIAMPTITATEEKVAALFLVGDHDSNFVAFRCSGAYTVDWGDGNTENVASNTTAEHNYVYTDLSASTEFGPAGSKSRQAMIVITPQAGQNLTAISFAYRHSTLTSTYTTPILEITLSAPNCTSLLMGSNIGNLRLLEQCTILSHNTTSMNSTFRDCTSLQSVPLFDTSSVTNMFAMFYNCNSLQSVPLFDTSSVTSMTSMFYNCFSLQSVPLFDTSSVTSMWNMFYACTSLQTIPALDCSASTNMANFALNCYGLKRVQATGIRATVSFANCTLGPDELDEIYTALADLTGLTGQTITVTGNYGTASDNPSIATAKNWTVTG